MPPKCPICKIETTKERAINRGTKITDYVCENCTIVWYIGKDAKMHIRISSTHSKASKLNDDGFDKLMKRILEYEKQ